MTIQEAKDKVAHDGGYNNWSEIPWTKLMWPEREKYINDAMELYNNSRQDVNSGETGSKLFMELFILSYKYMNHPHDTEHFKELNLFFTKHLKFCEKCKEAGVVNEPNKPEKHDCEFCDGLGFAISIPTQSAKSGESLDVAREIVRERLEVYSKKYSKLNWLPFDRVDSQIMEFILHCMLDFRDHQNPIQSPSVNKEEIIRWIDNIKHGENEAVRYALESVKKKILSLPPNSETVGMPSDVEKKVRAEIERLEKQKSEYKDDDDRYSWHIVDDEQEVWKKALNWILGIPDPEPQIEDPDELPF